MYRCIQRVICRGIIPVKCREGMDPQGQGVGAAGRCGGGCREGEVAGGEVRRWLRGAQQLRAYARSSEPNLPQNSPAVFHLQVIRSYVSRLKPMIADTILMLNQGLNQSHKILVEGANAAMLDIDFG